MLNFHCKTMQTKAVSQTPEFPAELVQFESFAGNPVFKGTGTGTWDNGIRERGYILHEGRTYHMWYTGYSNKTETKFLGYASSLDGITWKRYEGNPIFTDGWVEDVYVIKEAGIYYMFAEGKNDVAHMLTSTDRFHWIEKGNLDIRQVDGKPIESGPYGTPTVLKVKEKWYLFYERNDQGVWLAVSDDLLKWTNVQNEPVLKMGPDMYDKFGIAMNQVVKYKGLYYGYYHATAFKDWHEWSTNVAVSGDLIHWTKYGSNPIIGNNKSSGILVKDKKQFRLYTMHRQVNIHVTAKQQ